MRVRVRAGMSQDFVCRIPLKPTNEPPKEEEVRRLLLNPKFKLVDEFAVRYLESIGASPTPANIRKVKAEIPVKRFKLKAAYKSRGGLEDMIYMEKVEPKNEGRHLWRGCAARSLFSEMVDKKLAATTPAAASETTKEKSALGILGGGGAGKTERDSARTGVLLPKLGTANLPPPNRPAPMSPERRDDIATRVALAHLATQSSQERMQSRTASSRKGRRSQVGAPDFAEEKLEPDVSELQIKVTMDDVLSIQTMFTRTFPLSHIRERVPAQDLAVLVGEMTGIGMAQLILNLCQLCEWAIVHNFRPPPGHKLADPGLESFRIRPRTGGDSASPPAAGDAGGAQEADLTPAVEQILVDTFSGWVEIQGRVTKRAHTVVAYPIYLMLVRVAVETVMRNAVPSLFKGPKDEVLVLEKIERIISAMLDPDGYLNYPLPAPPGKAMIEGLMPARPQPEGVPALKSRPWAPLSGSQAQKINPAARFYTVSPHVKTLLSSSNCPELSLFRHARGSSQGEAVRTPRGDGKGMPAKDEIDFGEILTKVLSKDNLQKTFQLVLKKRDMLRKLGVHKDKSKSAGEHDDETLNAILPLGVDHLKHRPGLGAAAPA